MPARVLVVDDLAVNIRLLEAKLVSEYYEVLSASNGPAALELVRARAPDIVLLEVMMPIMDGFEVCRQIKADPATRHIPVVMVTALSETRDRVRGLESGADDFLTKPINDIALLARIKSLVRLKRVAEEWRTRAATSLQFGIEAAAIDESVEISRGRLLVVANDGPPRTRIVEILSRHWAAVDIAANTQQAVAAASEHDYHVILCDDRPAGEDALRLCSQLRTDKRTRNTPILLMVPPNDDKRLVTAFELGVNAYIVKPADRDEIVARTRTQVRQKLYDEKLRASYRERLDAAFTDNLTGLNNRHYLEAHFHAVVERLAAAGKPIGVMILDIDRFKAINDSFGHAVGDEVLKAVTQRILASLRTHDTAVRLGGEEFLVLMPEATLAEAGVAAERVRRTIGETAIPVACPQGAVEVTISIGVTATPAGAYALEDIIKIADAALYEAKRAGRNRVVTTDCAAKLPIPGQPDRASSAVG